jgi:hypothetical protein
MRLTLFFYKSYYLQFCIMKTKNILITLFIATQASTVSACDMCGCFMGIVPYDNQSSISFLHRYRSFSGYVHYSQPGTFFPTSSFKVPQNSYLMHAGTTAPTTYSRYDYEIYKVNELRAKYFIHKRVELNAIVPLNDYSSLINDDKLSHTGLGDITIYAGYHAIQKTEEAVFQQRLIVGGGIKLPTANYGVTADDGDLFPFLLQPGTGSLDYFGYVNYIIGYKKAGLSLNNSYKINGTNADGMRIANSTTNYASLFFKVQAKQFVIIPSIQFYYEYSKGVYDHDTLQAGTSMNVGLIGPGLDIYYKNISLNLSVQFKAFEKVDVNELGSAGRMAIGIGYNFNQKKYLLGRKEKADTTAIIQ